MAVRIIRGLEDLVASGSQLVWSLAHETLRTWYSRGLIPCRRLLESWFKMGKCYQMTEGRVCQIHLLDGRKLELLVQPKLLSRELLDLVASHFTLKEKEYFGLCFIDDIGQNNWLQLDRKVLDHAFSKTSGPLEIKFLVRFYVVKITLLKENTTVELFYLNAKSLVFNETIEVESEHVFKLAAFALQEAKGDYSSAETTASDLKQLPVLPTRVLREHPSLNYCEERVIEHYKKLKGVTRGQAIVKYLALVESLPTYGVHYYPVKDKQGIPWWLGVSYKGIGQYDLQDKLKPRKLFQWKQLENLYFREKKFAVEVNDPHRRTVTKRTFGQAGLVIHSWYASHSLIKTIWAMAISQHQFYLDMKQTKSNMTTTRSSSDIAVDLTELNIPRISKLSNDPLIMASNGSLISTGSADSEVSEEQKKEKIAELKKKEKDLQDKLTQKLEELKKICMREAEITGKLPKEYPLATGEKAPPVRRRVGTTFKLDDLNLYDKDPHLRNLESKRALQQKIVEAAERLLKEDGLDKTVKRKRRNNHLDSKRKLEDIEREINNYKIGARLAPRGSLISADDAQCSELSSLSGSLTLDDDDELGSQRERSRSVQYSPRPHHAVTLDIFHNKDRRPSANVPLPAGSSRLNYDPVQESLHYSHIDGVSSSNSPLRRPCDARSMPPTPLLTRNAYSSTQLRSEDAAQHFHQRSGSLESLSQLMMETKPPVPCITVSAARRCNSTEVIDDGSSHTSQSSVEYSAPGNHTQRRRTRGRHRNDLYANTGSMPNLAQSDTRFYTYQPQGRPNTTAYYVTGYPNHLEPEPYTNRVYMYEDELEGHYNVNPSYHHYHHAQQGYYGHDVHPQYGSDVTDCLSHNVYATIRPPRNRQAPRGTEQVSRSIPKALVVEHLKGWYQRNAPQKQGTHHCDYNRGSQHSLSYQTMPAPYPHNHRNMYYSSVSSASSSSGNWHMSNRGMSDYDMPMHESFSCSYSTAPYGHPTHSRSATSQLFRGSWFSPDGQRRFFPSRPSSSSTSPPSDPSFPSSPYSPGCRVRQVVPGPVQQQLSRGHRLSKVPFAEGSS
ncbi:FERM domain-containing protein 4B-like isoform X4 [Xiphophorus maculatus]|uniref:FERM domain-containing protein 4B-like n=1 Tax=Xiphophorus maculatus TaxID=8083 RepID=A0A3B5QT47_XIPMA|nr:FERM domain-containing protein 4B-like isoform X2 [Xiphophorus maculatus]XP_023180378.1 FERM domain-containing protein 4B-like isoform X3 [Xiphophorus maculatus]XP_023180379.1 FERM domain-containing protein 4B-like isoform X4 [Xiphophorus maculatus]